MYLHVPEHTPTLFSTESWGCAQFPDSRLTAVSLSPTQESIFVCKWVNSDIILGLNSNLLKKTKHLQIQVLIISNKLPLALHTQDQ